jgi:hypothetical protein
VCQFSSASGTNLLYNQQRISATRCLLVISVIVHPDAAFLLILSFCHLHSSRELQPRHRVDNRPRCYTQKSPHSSALRTGPQMVNEVKYLGHSKCPPQPCDPLSTPHPHASHASQHATRKFRVPYSPSSQERLETPSTNTCLRLPHQSPTLHPRTRSPCCSPAIELTTKLQPWLSITITLSLRETTEETRLLQNVPPLRIYPLLKSTP